MMGSGGQDPAGSVADGVAWSPSSIHSEKQDARVEGYEASRSDSTPPRVFLPPEEAQEAARKRFVNFTQFFKTVLQKADFQAQERPISEQIRITKMFIKKRRRLTVPQPAITPNVRQSSAGCKGLSTVCSKKSHTFGVGVFVSHIAAQRRRHGGRSPSQENQGGTTDPCNYQWLCAENTSRNHWRSWSESRLWDPQAMQRNSSVIAMNRRTTGQYGLRGVRVGSEPSRATKIVVATSRPSQHSRGCYSGGYTRGSRRHSSW